MLAWLWAGMAVVWAAIIVAIVRKATGWPPRLYWRRDPLMRAAIRSEAAAIKRAAGVLWGVK